MQPNEKIEQLYFQDLKKGNEKAFEYFFNKYYGHVLGFCIQFIGNTQEAKGVTQEAFLNLWLNRASIEKPNGIKSFLYTFSKSKCLNALRHKKVKQNYQSTVLNEKERQLNIEILHAMNFDALVLTELEQLIQNSIENLPHKTKLVFRKKRIENKKNREIAEELNITLKTVEAHFTKALKILRFNLADHLPFFILLNILLQ